jgi:hypothetical protein
MEYVAPGNHRTLKAERAIRDAKNHLISMLCTTNKKIPLNLYDKCKEQFEITINTLRSYKSNKSISAYEGIHGHQFNFKKHPIAPFGTLVLVHNKPTTRGSFVPHGDLGYYLGPKLNGYRLYNTFIIATKTCRVTDTIEWFPGDKYKVPIEPKEELIVAGISDLIKAIQITNNNEITDQTRTEENESIEYKRITRYVYKQIKFKS